MSNVDTANQQKTTDEQNASSARATREHADEDTLTQPLRMSPSGGDDKLELHDALRTFHFTGERPGFDETCPIDAPLLPAVLTAWLKPGLRWQEFPLFVPAADRPEETIRPFAALLKRAADELKREGVETAGWRDEGWRLARAAAGVLHARGGSGSIREVLAEARATFTAEAADSDDIVSHWEPLSAKLPEDGTLLGLGEDTLLELYAIVLNRHRRAAREVLCAELNVLVPQLEDRLRLDKMHKTDSRTAQEVTAAMGKAAESFIDASALAEKVPAHRGTTHMAPEHRQQIEEALALFRRFFEIGETEPEFVVVHSGDLPAGVSLPPASTVRDPDAFATAIRLFDEAADEMVPFARALRLARLEVASEYQPSVHDKALARVDRESLTAGELTLVRAVVVLESTRAIEGPAGASYSKLLQSSRPIHALVLHDAMGHDEAESGSRFNDYDPGLGYRSVAHREAHVLQTTLAEPHHLARGLQEMVKAVRPGVAFVGGRPWTGGDIRPWLQSVAEHQGRASPCFQYAPDDGGTWAASFVLSHNPQPDVAWPCYTVRYLEDEAEKDLELRVTFADCAALDPSCRGHFCVIPANGWDAGQVELCEYLNRLPAELLQELPFIWVVDDKGELQRALLTRELALACRDRMRAWRVLQELGGIHNEYARRAAERLREEAQSDLETSRKEMEQAHTQDVEKIRREAMQETVNRLVARLLGLEEGPVASPAPAAPVSEQTSAPASAAPASANAEEPSAAPEAAAVEDPYIESVLCTSCDDCINLNPRMFKYNEDKQAKIADPTAGTFAQLVKAASMCPAACIHPGSPRPGDTTATDKLIAKAAEFN